MFIKGAISFVIAHLMLFGGYNTKVYVAPIEKPQTQATSTITNIAPTTKQTIKISKIASSTTKTLTKKISPASVKLPATKSTTPIPTIVPSVTQPEPDFVAINDFARKATVNILCTTKGGELSPISGTGAIVEPDGLILTNAHLGQYFLLRDFIQKDYVQCIARTGSPAYPTYTLELVYISPTWVENNKSILKDSNPKGTGENDFAFLKITGMVDGSNLPSNFPFVTMNIRENIDVGEPVLLSSYPAGFLGGLSILQDLSITTAVTKIQDLFTFKDGTIDIVAVGGTVISQKGSSGGLVVDKDKTLIGVISTSSDGNTTSERGLNAITLSYINRDLQKELGINLLQFLTQDTGDFAKTFASTTAPLLTKIITNELSKQ